MADAHAAAWAARLDATGGVPCATLQADLDAWLASNPRHRGALLRAQALLHLATQAADPPMVLQQPKLRWHTAMRAPVATALGMALVAALAIWAMLDPGAQRYATGKGELRRIALADGSALTLDAASTLRVELEPHEREVHLKEGRALFRVSHDRARPFHVNVGHITITDIGTVFSVSKENDAITVLVSEGEVEVRDGNAVTRVTAGHMWRLAPQTPARLTIVPASQATRALAWSSGRLELDGETLSSAIVEFNRYNVVQIRLARAALGQEKFYGVFRLDDPESFARAVALGGNGAVRKEEGTWVIE